MVLSLRRTTAAALVLAAAACGPSDTQTPPPRDDSPPPAETAAAAPAAPSAPTAEVEPDVAALLRAIGVEADADGRVVNACDKAVVPLIVAVDLGAASARAVVIPGGPEAPTCYGDGPGAVHLVTLDDGGPKLVLLHLGYIGILETETDGVRDVALGGPGFSFPVFVWDGGGYTAAGRAVADADFAAATVVP